MNHNVLYGIARPPCGCQAPSFRGRQKQGAAVDPPCTCRFIKWHHTASWEFLLFFCTSPPHFKHSPERTLSANTASDGLTIPYRYCLRRLPCLYENILARESTFSTSAKCGSSATIFLSLRKYSRSGERFQYVGEVRFFVCFRHNFVRRPDNTVQVFGVPAKRMFCGVMSGAPAKRMFCGVMSGAPTESIFGGVSLWRLSCYDKNISAHSRIPRASAKCVFLCVSAVTLSGALTIPRNYSGVPAEFLQEIRWGIIPGSPQNACFVGYFSAGNKKAFG